MKTLSAKQLLVIGAALKEMQTTAMAAMGAEEQIQYLIREHGARRTTGPTGSALTCGGIRTTCTWSETEGLLTGWRRLANRAIQRTSPQGQPGQTAHD